MNKISTYENKALNREAIYCFNSYSLAAYNLLIGKLTAFTKSEPTYYKKGELHKVVLYENIVTYG